ncbi:MAG: DUF2520 domain-containing protein [Actinomycetota bacterium]
MRIRVVGRGRAGGSFATAATRVGIDVDLLPGTTTAIQSDDVDLVLLCVPDDSISAVADRVLAGPAVIAHCAGSRDLGVLGQHQKRASIHPLMSLPDRAIGADRLLDHCTFAIAGDPLAGAFVARLGGRSIEVADTDRAVYHAAACVAANHLVVLCAQVERLADLVGVPVDAYWTMMRHSLANVERQGARSALTGPAARGDVATIAAHLDALPEDERSPYSALADAARALASSSDLGDC